MSKNINVPKLRFKEFSGEWEKKKLGDIASFSKGKGISKSDIVSDGKLKCIRYGELYTHYNEVISTVISTTNLDKKDLVLSEYGDVIIPSSGETQIDIATASCVLKDNIALGGDLNIIKTKENGIFLSYYLNNKKKLDIARLSQGISVVHLYNSQLTLLNVKLPQKQEQEKIAIFLSSVDEKIEKLTKKDELLQQYKKSIMQKIFSQEIRFKEDNGNKFPEWKEKKLEEIGKTYNGLTNKNKENFGFGKPYIQYKQIFDNNKIDINKFELVEILSNENQNKVLFGDVFFTISSETPNEIGMSAVLLDEIEELYLNSFCFGFRANSLDELSPYYARYFFRSNMFRKNIIKLAQGSTRYNMSKIELLKLKIKLPCIEEQNKIANFLSNIDDKIEENQKVLEKIKEFKKSLLQQMFV